MHQTRKGSDCGCRVWSVLGCPAPHGTKSHSEFLALMALLDTTQAMYGGVTSQYLMQSGYRNSAYYREYEQDALARLNLQQRLGSSPEQHYDLHARLLVKEERLASLPPNIEPYCSSPTAFKPYSSPGQENLPLPQHVNQPTKVRSRSGLTPARSGKSFTIDR